MFSILYNSRAASLRNKKVNEINSRLDKANEAFWRNWTERELTYLRARLYTLYYTRKVKVWMMWSWLLRVLLIPTTQNQQLNTLKYAESFQTCLWRVEQVHQVKYETKGIFNNTWNAIWY